MSYMSVPLRTMKRAEERRRMSRDRGIDIRIVTFEEDVAGVGVGGYALE